MSRPRRLLAASAIALSVLAVPACSTDEEPSEPAAIVEADADGSVALADGAAWGVEWSLRGRSDAVICLDLEDGSGGTGSDCGLPVDPGDIRFGSQQANEQAPMFVVGQVGKKVASVDVALAGGGSARAELITVGGWPVNVYVAVLPPGSSPTRVVARNSLGLKVASSS